ncbi:MAG: hypothetical protein EOO53_11490 [Gammaproteobacteria bacterium]|nr:MAG: hypothetical protein EOO53_11490 [Gammaproteobacteria bacterium]
MGKIKHLVLINLIFSSFTFADAVNKEIIFGDHYIGYLPFYDYPSPNTGYRQADISSKIATPVSLLSGCVTGDGGSCNIGIPYKKIFKDKTGNIFYLVKTNDQQEIWTLPPANIQTSDFNIEVGAGGSDIIYADNEALTNTEKQDKVPNLNIERISAFEKMRAALSYNRGEIELQLPKENNAIQNEFKVWPSSEKPPLNPIILDKENFEKLVVSDLDAPLTVEFLRMSGDYLLIKRHGNSDKIFTYAVSTDYEDTYFWLDTSKLGGVKHLIPYDFSKDYYDPLVINEFLSVEKIEIFNGNEYALISNRYQAIDPLNFNKTDKTFAELTFSVPLYWVKIRDTNGRLRFWFDLYIGC